MNKKMEEVQEKKALLKKKQEFLDRIKQTRLSKGWSLYRLSQVTGMDRTYLLRIERGSVSLGLNNLVCICEALDLDIVLEPKRKMLDD